MRSSSFLRVRTAVASDGGATFFQPKSEAHITPSATSTANARFLEEKASRDEDAEAYGILVDVANFIIERVGRKGMKAGEIATTKGPVAPIVRRRSFTVEEIDDASDDITLAADALFEKALRKAYNKLDGANDAIYSRADIGDRAAGAVLIEFADAMVKKAASLLPVEDM